MWAVNKGIKTSSKLNIHLFLTHFIDLLSVIEVFFMTLQSILNSYWFMLVELANCLLHSTCGNFSLIPFFSNDGWQGLIDEITMEVERLSYRNLGRDDRIIADHGREARMPYLDENVVNFLCSLPMSIKVSHCIPFLHKY